MLTDFDNHKNEIEDSKPTAKAYADRMDEINKKAMQIFAERKSNLKEETLEAFTQSEENTQILNPGKKSVPLEELLIVNNLISKDQLQVALKQQRESKQQRNLGEVLVELGFIQEDVLANMIAEASGIETFDLKSAALDVELIRKVPKNVAIQYKIIPISLEDDNLYVATTDVFNIIAFDQVKRYFDRKVKVIPKSSNEMQITDVIDKYYDYEMSVDGILREMEMALGKGNNLLIEEQGYLNPTVRLVDAILFDAIRRGASDIHFEPEQNFVRLRYRMDGKLVQILTLHKDYWSSIVVRLKILAGLNIAETRNPQDGRLSYLVMGRTVDFRMSTMPVVYGENIVARILDKSKALMPIADLGMGERNENLLKLLLKRPEGIIILTGPTGCGKSTTLYSMLSYINSIDVNIMTLEDPVEYQLPIIRQSGVREGGMNFSDGIRSMMRQDPDVIFVGEVRDKDTASMTIRAAMTGHQVFTTLHTNDSVGAIPRLIDLGIKPSLLAGTMIGIIAQRLARRLCQYCKIEYTPNKEECKILNVDPNQPPQLYKPTGCQRCYDTGYKGRIGLFEIFPIDREMDDLIAREASRKEMLTYAMQIGFMPLANDAVRRVLEGQTSLEEVIGTVDLTERMK